MTFGISKLNKLLILSSSNLSVTKYIRMTDITEWPTYGRSISMWIFESHFSQDSCESTIYDNIRLFNSECHVFDNQVCYVCAELSVDQIRRAASISESTSSTRNAHDWVDDLFRDHVSSVTSGYGYPWSYDISVKTSCSIRRRIVWDPFKVRRLAMKLISCKYEIIKTSVRKLFAIP